MSNFYKRGDNVFLYVKFKDDKNNSIIVENPQVKIVHEKNGQIVTDLDWTNLTHLNGSNEYYFNYFIDYLADYSSYQVLYSAQYGDKEASVMEDFRVIPSSDTFSDVIRIYGIVNQLRLGYPLIGVDVTVNSNDNDEIISQYYTKEDGTWEVFLYPGEYKISFNKYGFATQEFFFQVGHDNNEIQFDNVALELQTDSNKGNGVYTISDKYTTREGMPIVGLNIKAYNIFSMNEISGQSDTNDEGIWELFLDPGTYLLKVSGIVFNDEFDQTFRLKVSEDGKFDFENLASNVAVPSNVEEITQGNGSIEVSDIVLDPNGNAIVDVQVNAFYKNNLNNIIAQDYTNPLGKWTLYLNPGTYVIEYYHPEFDVIMEDKTI